MLKNFWSDTENDGENEESKVEGSSARSVEDPVEAECKDKEGKAMENFVVDKCVELKGGKTGVACYNKQKEESSWDDVSDDGMAWAGNWYEPTKGSLMRMLAVESIIWSFQIHRNSLEGGGKTLGILLRVQSSALTATAREHR